MKDWQTPLRAAFSREDDAQLTENDVQKMRASVLAGIKADVRQRAGFAWMRPVAIAAAVIAGIGAGIVAGLRLDAPTATDAGRAAAGIVAGADPAETVAPRHASRQLQFLTPGGTRIIWVFNSELDLKATIR